MPREDAGKFAAGQQVEVAVGDDREIAPGLVEFVSPTVDAQSGTCRVKVRIDNPRLKWLSGVECRLNPSRMVKRNESAVSNVRQSSTGARQSPLPNGR